MRVSIDSGGSKATSSSSSSSSKSAKGGKAGKGGQPLDKAQKIKAGVAIGVIVLAGVFILWQSGIFESTPAPSKGADPTPEQLQDMAKQQPGQPETKSGARLAPPRPLGSQ